MSKHAARRGMFTPSRVSHIVSTQKFEYLDILDISEFVPKDTMLININDNTKIIKTYKALNTEVSKRFNKQNTMTNKYALLCKIYFESIV